MVSIRFVLLGDDGFLGSCSCLRCYPRCRMECPFSQFHRAHSVACILNHGCLHIAYLRPWRTGRLVGWFRWMERGGALDKRGTGEVYTCSWFSGYSGTYLPVHWILDRFALSSRLSIPDRRLGDGLSPCFLRNVADLLVLRQSDDNVTWNYDISAQIFEGRALAALISRMKILKPV